MGPAVCFTQRSLFIHWVIIDVLFVELLGNFHLELTVAQLCLKRNWQDVKLWQPAMCSDKDALALLRRAFNRDLVIPITSL